MNNDITRDIKEEEPDSDVEDVVVIERREEGEEIDEENLNEENMELDEDEGSEEGMHGMAIMERSKKETITD